MRDHLTTFVARSRTPGFVPKCRESVCRWVLFGTAIACSLATGEATAAVTTQPPAARQEKEANLGPVKAIVDGMQNAGVRLKQGDTGTGTRTIQEKVVNDLQKLIDEAKSKSRRRQQQQKSESKQNQSSQDRSDSQQKPGSDAASGTQPASGKPGANRGWESLRSRIRDRPGCRSAHCFAKSGAIFRPPCGSAYPPIFTRRSCPPTTTWCAAISSRCSIARRSAAPMCRSPRVEPHLARPVRTRLRPSHQPSDMLVSIARCASCRSAPVSSM